jgi:hypothetical protein
MISFPIKFDYTGKHPWDKLKKRIRNEINVGDLLSGSYEDALKWVLNQMDEVMKETDIVLMFLLVCGTVSFFS